MHDTKPGDSSQGDTTRRADAELESSDPSNLEQVVMQMLVVLYPRVDDVSAASTEVSQTDGSPRELAAPAESSAPLTPAAHSSTRWRPVLGIGGWSLAAVGYGLLVTGTTLGTLAKRDHRQYARIDIVGEAEVDRATELLDRAQRRARQANRLLAAGAATAALGVGSLFVAWLRPREHGESKLALGVWPTPGGAAFTVAGSMRRD